MTIPIPLWGAVVAGISFVAPIVWAMITMFFTQKETKTILESMNKRIDVQEKLINFLDSKMESKHDDMDKKFSDKIEKVKDDIGMKLMEISTTVTETKAIVSLIVIGKLKDKE